MSKFWKHALVLVVSAAAQLLIELIMESRSDRRRTPR
jgi:hypothetical protein